MAKGNPNPDTSGLKPFEPGQSGNPGGKTSEQRKAEIANAEKATIIRGRLLDAVIEATADGASLEFIEAGMLKLIKDAEDRGLGTARQSVDHTSSDGSMTPKDGGSALDEINRRLDRLAPAGSAGGDTGGAD